MNDFLQSGILEAYILGTATDAEMQQVQYLVKTNTEVRQALLQLETDLEQLTQASAIPPPPMLWQQIEDNINALTHAKHNGVESFKEQPNGHTYIPGDQYIEVEAQSQYMRVHKAWKAVFIAVFILGKIFLGCAIYFYLENKHAQEKIQELKIEVRK